VKRDISESRLSQLINMTLTNWEAVGTNQGWTVRADWSPAVKGHEYSHMYIAQLIPDRIAAKRMAAAKRMLVLLDMAAPLLHKCGDKKALDVIDRIMGLFGDVEWKGVQDE